MPATLQDIAVLHMNLAAYDYPAAVWNVDAGVEQMRAGMGEVETLVAAQLHSGYPEQVGRGLASVVHWGFARQPGLAPVRVHAFLDLVTVDQLGRAAVLFGRPEQPTLYEIRALHLPQFSRVSLVSKLLTFLDIQHNCVLDRQIAHLWQFPDVALHLGPLVVYPTYIPITIANAATYAKWVAACGHIAQSVGVPRPVDAERALFQLIQIGERAVAADIVARAAACMNRRLGG